VWHTWVATALLPTEDWEFPGKDRACCPLGDRESTTPESSGELQEKIGPIP
jgi:hypothetical protein